MKFYFDDITIGRKKILPKGSFELADKGVYVINGKNGAGKSLLINQIFNSLVEKNISSVFIDQSHNRILEKESVLNNISLSYETEINTSVISFLKKYELDYILEHTSKKASGGESRLLCLLRGLVLDSKIYIIDEPTNDLDFNITKKIIDLIKEKGKESLLIIVSHDDRIISIADGVLTINQANLISSTIDITHENDSELICNNNYTKEKNIVTFLKKQFHFNYVSLFLGLFCAISTMFFAYKVSMVTSSLLPSMNENQIDIYAPISDYGNTIEDGSLPIKFASLLNGDTTITDFVNEYSKDDNSNNNINFTLNMSSTESYKVYKLEYYDIFEHKNHIVINDYIELTNQKNVDCSNYFDFPGDTLKGGSPKQKVDITKFDAIAKKYDKISGRDYQPYALIFCSIVLEDGYSMSDFFNSDEFKKIADGNFYIHSNETIDIINSAIVLQTQKDAFLFLLVSFISSILIELTYVYLYIKTKHKVIRIFRNMAYKKEIISYNLNTAMHNGKIKLFFCALLSVPATINLMFIYDKNLILIYLLYYIYIAISHLCIKIFCQKYAERFTDWRYR